MDNIYVHQRNEGEFVLFNFTNATMKNTDLAGIQEIKRNFQKQKNDCIKDVGDVYKRIFVDEEITGYNPVIFTGYDCNYTCEYCYEKNHIKDLSKHVVKNLEKVEEFYKAYSEWAGKSYEIETVSLIGGEPLIDSNRTLINEITNHWKNVKIIISTNGTNIIEFSDILQAVKCVFHVSLDGIRDTHYKKRHPKEEDYYDRTIAGIKWAIRNKKEISVLTTFFPENLYEYSAFFDLLEELGWKEGLLNIGFMPLFEGCGRIISDSYYKESVDALCLLFEKDPRLARVDISAFVPGLETYYQRKKKIHYCSSLYSADYVFRPNGKVYICQATERPELCIGTFKPEIQIDYNKIIGLLQRNIINMQRCKKCEYGLMCRGGCVAAEIENCNTIQEGDCGIWKTDAWKKAYELYFNMR